MKTIALHTTAVVAATSLLVSADATALRRTLQDSEPACAVDCTRNEFCGIDGQCYPWSCDNWLNFGTWTRLGNDTVPEGTSLSCSSYGTGQQDNLHAIVFSCS